VGRLLRAGTEQGCMLEYLLGAGEKTFQSFATGALTKRLLKPMDDDNLPWQRSESMLASNVESVVWRLWAISLRDLQNSSSRVTLVLCPDTATERLTTRDFNTIHTPAILDALHQSNEVVSNCG
jgi:hypothetical protein